MVGQHGVHSSDIRKAELAYRQGRLADAERIVRVCLANQPDSWQVLHLTGLICAGQSRLQEAVHAFRSAIKADAARMESWNALAQLLSIAGRLDEADRVCREALAVNSHSAELFSNHSIVLERMGRLTEALEQAKTATRLKRGLSGAHFNLARILEKLNRYGEAAEACQRAIKLEPGNADFHNLYGVILHNQGKLPESSRAFRKALHLRPGHAIALNNLASNCKDSCNLEQAADYAREAIRQSPRYFEAYYNLALVYAEQDKLDDAISTYQKALELNPDHAAACYSYGIALKAAGKPVEGREFCERAVAVDPGSAIAHLNLGSVLLTLGDKERALEEYTVAVQLKPECAEAHRSRGGLLMELGNFEEARHALEAALYYHPDEPMARYLLASLDGHEIPERMDDSSVRELFDDYAHRFDSHLVGSLAYRAPQQLVESLRHTGLPTRQLEILDLGCGTGLCGLELAHIANHLVGIDLSPRMLERAKQLNIYTRLIQSEVGEALAGLAEQFDLIVATDVLTYIGRLEGLFAAVAAHLHDQGLFSFSIESLDNGEDYVLRETGRYAQSYDYILRLARSNRMDVLRKDDFVIRLQRGEPVPGQLIVLRAAR